MFRGDLTFLRVLRFVVLLLPLMASVAMGQPPIWPWGLWSLIGSLVIALGPFFRVRNKPWPTVMLIVEVVLSIFVGFSVSGPRVWSGYNTHPSVPSEGTSFNAAKSLTFEPIHPPAIIFNH